MFPCRQTSEILLLQTGSGEESFAETNNQDSSNLYGDVQRGLTDITKFHYYIGMEKHKVCLNAILSLFDRRIAVCFISDNNNFFVKKQKNIKKYEDLL